MTIRGSTGLDKPAPTPCAGSQSPERFERSGEDLRYLSSDHPEPPGDLLSISIRAAIDTRRSRVEDNPPDLLAEGHNSVRTAEQTAGMPGTRRQYPRSASIT